MLSLKGIIIVASMIIVMMINVTMLLSAAIGIFNGIKMHDYMIIGMGLSIGIFNAVVLLNAITILINALKYVHVVKVMIL